MSAISQKYNELGGSKSFLGKPTTPERQAPDGVGRYRHYQHGSIYFHPNTGAHEVHGAIRAKWKALGWERSFLGYPLTDETKTPDGRGRFNHFQGGSVYWTRKTGAYEVHGDIRRRWRSLAWERGGLGYPISDEENAPRGGRISRFEHGSIHWQKRDVSNLTFFQQNMGLLVAPASYKGKERDKAIQALIAYLRKKKPDVVGLSECFADGERDRIKSSLRNIYRWSIEGPDEKDLESDGGLLILSRHQITAQHQTIYRQCLGEDCLANKGVLHARIRVKDHPTRYDIFLSHLQASNTEVKVPDIGPGSSGRAKIKQQLSHLASFIQAHTNTFKNPTLLMGDLNTNALSASQYRDFLRRLHHPQDLWLTSGDGSKGITGNPPDNTFSGRPDARRKGSRIDYFLSWPGRRFWPTYRRTRVVKLESSRGRHISDHYGLTTELINLRDPKETIKRTIGRVSMTLLGFHCLQVTGGPIPVASKLNPDEVEFRFSYNTAKGQKLSSKTKLIRGIENGEFYRFRKSAPELYCSDPGRWLDIMVQGWEKDPIDVPFFDRIGETGSTALGRARIRLAKRDILQLVGRSEDRILPMLTGDGSEYAVKVRIRVDAVDRRRRIRMVKLALKQFDCLTETSGGGSDEVYFELGYSAASGANARKRTGVKGGIDTGESYTYPRPVTLEMADPGRWLDVHVKGWEEDSWPGKDDKLGTTKIRLERSELLTLVGRGIVSHKLPYLTGDGGRYAMTVNLTVM